MAKKLDKPSAKLEPIRVYADTSVYGGVFDPEFAAASRDAGASEIHDWGQG